MSSSTSSLTSLLVRMIVHVQLALADAIRSGMTASSLAAMQADVLRLAILLERRSTGSDTGEGGPGGRVPPGLREPLLDKLDPPAHAPPQEPLEVPYEQTAEPTDWAADFSHSMEYIEEPDEVDPEDAICGP